MIWFIDFNSGFCNSELSRLFQLLEKDLQCRTSSIYSYWHFFSLREIFQVGTGARIWGVEVVLLLQLVVCKQETIYAKLFIVSSPHDIQRREQKWFYFGQDGNTIEDLPLAE